MRSNPVRGAFRGAVAGAAGTIGMDLLWYARYRKGGGGDHSAHLVFGTVTGATLWAMARRA